MPKNFRPACIAVLFFWLLALGHCLLEKAHAHAEEDGSPPIHHHHLGSEHNHSKHDHSSDPHGPDSERQGSPCEMQLLNIIESSRKLNSLAGLGPEEAQIPWVRSEFYNFESSFELLWNFREYKVENFIPATRLLIHTLQCSPNAPPPFSA